MEKLNQDYKEFIELLNARKVDYIVVGAFAMAFHGHPRYTGDIDFWIRNSEANARNVFQTIVEFGFPPDNLSEKDFTSNDLIFQMGYPPVRIDVLTSIEALSFEECFLQKETRIIDGLTIPYLNIKDLIKNKKAVGRKKDLADLEELRKNK
ncbi:MAG: nucleotidyltransferase [bacterium]